MGDRLVVDVARVNVKVQGFGLLLGTEDTDADSPQLGAKNVGRVDRAGVELALTESKACRVAEVLGVLTLRFLVDLSKRVDRVDKIRI